MKTFIIASALFIGISFGVQGQDCSAYIIMQQGKTAEYVHKDKKDKVQSYQTQKLLSKKNVDGAERYEILQISKDKNGKQVAEDTLTFECRNGEFYIDMNRYIDESQFEAYEESQIRVEFENISYPKGMKPGTTLNDGSVTVTIDLGMMTLTNETRIINRKVEARESVTTPAGTFDCLKISHEVENKIGFVTVKVRSVSWIAENIGGIKTETYDNKDRLMGSSELISLK